MIENYQSYGAFKPTGTTIGLDLTSTSQSTPGTLSESVLHFATTVACHVEWSTSGAVVANNTHTLFMPGERLIKVPAGHYMAAVKVAGQPDGILRATIVES